RSVGHDVRGRGGQSCCDRDQADAERQLSRTHRWPPWARGSASPGLRTPARMSFVSELFATTNVDKLREMGKSKVLRRALTAKDLVAIGLGTMIGGGIFTTIGTGVKGAGPA